MNQRIRKAALVSPIVHPMVFYIFHTSFPRFTLPEQWKLQFSMLLLCSFLFSLVPLLSSRKNVNTFFLFLRFIILLMAGYPLGSNLLIETLLLFGILYDLYLFFPLSVALPFSAGGTVIVFFMQRVDFIWNKVQLKPVWEDKLAALFLIAGINVFLILFNRFRKRAVESRLQFENYEETVQNLMDVNLRLQETTVKEIDEAVNTERSRIARDLHDIVGHSMVNIMMLAESIKDSLRNGRGEAQHLIKMTRDQAQMVLQDTEATLRTLKERETDRKYDIVAIKRLSGIFQKATGINVILEFRNVPFSFGEDIDRIVYRIIQECMTNAFRHGKATEIKILFWKYEREIEIFVRDNGVGVKQVMEGIGLWGIRERLTSINGELTVPRTATGFELFIRFPWPQKPKQEQEMNVDVRRRSDGREDDELRPEVIERMEQDRPKK